MNIYQKNLVSFFRGYADLFLKQLLVTLPDDFTFIKDIFPHMINFIDAQLKKEMELHDKKSKGYQRHIDMLIELHLIRSLIYKEPQLLDHDEFKAAMIREINALFRQ